MRKPAARIACVLLLLALLGVLVVSCSWFGGPGDVAQNYLKALNALNFDDASQYVADEGRNNFQFIRNLYSHLKADEQAKFQVKDWKVGEVHENGETATVDFTFDQSKKGQLSLKKYNGAWKIDLRRTF